MKPTVFPVLRRFFQVVLPLAAALSLLACKGGSQATAGNTTGQPDRTVELENALLWEVSGNGLTEPSYLFGTYHLMDSSFAHQHPIILEKLEQTKVVVGELVMAPAKMQKLAFKAVMKDTTLKDLYTDEEYEKVNKMVEKATGQSLTTFNQFKPALVSQMINLRMMTDELDRDLGSMASALDGYLQSYGRRKDKEIIGLESVQDQVDALFNSLPVEKQADKLLEMVGEEDKFRKMAHKLDDCYTAEDLGCLYDLIPESGMTQEEQAALLDERNNRWLEQLPDIMREKGPAFIAIGALHMAGEVGLVNQLREAGYTLKPIPVTS